MNTRIIRFLLGTTIALAIAMLLFVLPTPASSAPTARYLIHVTTTTDEYDVAGNGTGCSLREAIKTANDGVNFGGCARIINPIGFGADTIVLPSGTYTLTLSGSGEDLDATGDLDIRNSMIIGTSSATPPIVTGDPNWIDRIFHILIGTATINGIVIRGGWVDADGGGAVRIESGASLIMNNSVVADSFAIGKYGGGIYNNSGTLSLNNVTLTNDRTTGSGQYGGGLYNFNGSATLTDVILSGNQASGEGGVYNLGTLILISDTLSGNSADVYGGGISNETGVLTMTDVTLDGNTSPYYGGGIFNNSGTPRLTNVTLSGNSAHWQSRHRLWHRHRLSIHRPARPTASGRFKVRCGRSGTSGS